MEFNDLILLRNREGPLEVDRSLSILLKVTQVTKGKVKNNMRTKNWELGFQVSD